MSATDLKAVFAGLCRGHGWSYGVVWRLDMCDPRLLIVEDVYCEEKVQGIVGKILNQVHIVGEGILGRAVVSGKDKWIFHDTYQAEFSAALNADNQVCGQGDIAWIHQQLDGFKTIALCSLPSFGLVQFGSTKKIPESLEFLAKIKVFLGLKFPKSKSHRGSNCTSTFFINEYDSTYENNPFQSMLDACLSNSSWVPTVSQSSSKLLGELFQDFRSHSMTTSSHQIKLPVRSCLTSFGDQFQTPSICSNSMFQVPNQTDTGEGDLQGFLSCNSNLLSTFNCPENAVVLPSVVGIPGIANLMPTSSFSPVVSERVFSQLFADSSSSPSILQQSLEYQISDSTYSGRSKGHLSSEQRFTLHQAGSSMANSLFDQPCFASDHTNTCVANLEMLTPLPSLLENEDDLTPSFLQPSQTEDNAIAGRKLPIISISSGSEKNDDNASIVANGLSGMNDMNMSSLSESSSSLINDNKEGHLMPSTQLLTDNSVFDCMNFNLNPSNFLQDYWEDIIMSSCSNLTSSVSEVHKYPILDSEKITFLESGPELDATVRENDESTSTDNYIVENGNFTDLCPEGQVSAISSNLGSHSVNNNQVSLECDTSLAPLKMLTNCKPEVVQGSLKEVLSTSIFCSKIEDSCSISTANSFLNEPKKAEEIPKVVKKRARPGESTRPRPKDRQQIQDRVKELREIIPNSGKCSIDALLDRTIKHMLFLQSVTKYADKLKQADEPKIIVKESGVVLKDNSGSGSNNGATWAYELAGQTIVCPIIVEDLSPPGQMLVEMLCEEHGFFLEIADIIRGFGLIILKGVMEVRACKIWARFWVETNRDVTRMDIFLSLVQLLQQTNSIRSCEQQTRVIQKGTHLFSNYEHSPSSVPVHHPEKL